MQTIINSENTVQTSTEKPALEKRVILETEEKITPKMDQSKSPSTIKYSYPTNGLYGLL